MGKKIEDANERIIQKSIGFRKRQIDFFQEHKDFRPDEFCREAIDNQIKLIDPNFLKQVKNEEKTN